MLHQGQSWCPPLHMLCGQAWFLSYPHHPQAQFSRISGHPQPGYSFPVESTISFCPPFPLTASSTYALATTEESSFESQHIYSFTGASFILYTFFLEGEHNENMVFYFFSSYTPAFSELCDEVRHYDTGRCFREQRVPVLECSISTDSPHSGTL